MSKPTNIKSLEMYFSGHNEITTSQLLDYLKHSFPEIKEGTLHWHISELVKDGSINRLSRGKYSLHPLALLDLNLSKQSARYMTRIVTVYPSRQLAAWDISMLHPFIADKPLYNILFIHTDRAHLDELFDTTLGISKDIYLDPDQRIVKSHIKSSEHSIVLQPLISETPVIEGDSFYILTIESIIVQLYINRDSLFNTLELDVDHIITKIHKDHTINNASLLRLASRLNKKKQIEKYLEELL